MAVASVLERLKVRIGVDRPATSATVEAGHLKRFAEAIGDPNPRWLEEAPPTFLVALAPASYHVPEAEEFGKGWLNGGNRFEYLEPVKGGDRITATGQVADVYEKSGPGGAPPFPLFHTQGTQPHGPPGGPAARAPVPRWGRRAPPGG